MWCSLSPSVISFHNPLNSLLLCLCLIGAGAVLRVSGVSCCSKVSGLSGPSLFCLRSPPCPRSLVSGLHVIYRIILLTKAAECEFASMTDQSEAVKEGRGFNSMHISCFSASQYIVVVCLQLLYGKTGGEFFCLSFLCSADSSVWSGHGSNQHSGLA